MELMGFLGRLNQEELSRAIGPFVKGNSIRMHNMLLVAMYGNSMRDLPPTDVAAWVSASDKPSAIAKMPAGDVNEKRLKKEVMAISARERRRIKEVPSAVSIVLPGRGRCLWYGGADGMGASWVMLRICLGVCCRSTIWRSRSRSRRRSRQ